MTSKWNELMHPCLPLMKRPVVDGRKEGKCDFVSIVVETVAWIEGLFRR